MRNFTPILFLSVVLSSMGHPAPSSAEATSFCLPVDSEMLERHLQRPAGKPALLNAGEPRTVRNDLLRIRSAGVQARSS